MKIGLLCGGPSLERGISLNSARSVLDHLKSEEIEIVPFYIDLKKNAYRISTSQLYSNTPSDFDFKLHTTSTPLSQSEFVKKLKETDIVFPVMHGSFGEDGGVQAFLEKHKIPFIGSGSASCKLAFDKFISNQFIKENGFFTLPSCVLKIFGKDHKQEIKKFFKENKIGRAVVKPASGGSSIGVFSVQGPEEALEKVNHLFSKRMDTRVVIEQFAEGKEFTAIILENDLNMPVAVLATEIETDYTENQIFDFRKKYLPTRRVTYHCPPRFSNEVIELIEMQAERLFKLFKMNDFARFDGWILPDGNIWFSDFNTISGMEQNSFLFQQSSRVGLTHRDTLRFILKHACQRQKISFPDLEDRNIKRKKIVNILFGGKTSERQVSLMSGTNVWLKLRSSQKYRPIPYLLGFNGDVWKLPYHLALNHTVEEIVENCRNAKELELRLLHLEKKTKVKLGISYEQNLESLIPEKISFTEFVKRSKFVFNALHGGDGEDGTFQEIFEKNGVLSNGPVSSVSRLCADKNKAKEFIEKLAMEGLTTVPGREIFTKNIINVDSKNLRDFWKKLTLDLGSRSLIVKPNSDGCSSGVVRLFESDDLKKYLCFISSSASFVPAKTFKGQTEIIEMPLVRPKSLLFEKYIETDILRVKNNRLKYVKKNGWLEVTIGVMTDKKGKIRVLNPSVTIAEGEVLSVEEKFQGGTGINITPPPIEIISKKTTNRAKNIIEKLASKLNITGYSRIDAFINTRSGSMMIIEINTLPGLTASTVLFHQALSEKQPIFPTEFLERLIENKGY